MMQRGAVEIPPPQLVYWLNQGGYALFHVSPLRVAGRVVREEAKYEQQHEKADNNVNHNF